MLQPGNPVRIKPHAAPLVQRFCAECLSVEANRGTVSRNIRIPRGDMPFHAPTFIFCRDCAEVAEKQLSNAAVAVLGKHKQVLKEKSGA